jgi:hypothetical protein
MQRSSSTRSISRAVVALSLAMAGINGAASPARAGLVLGIAADTATPGSSSNSFDVTLTNTGMNGLNIAGFSFELTTTSGDVTFSAVNVYTQSASYIFGANSEFGPDVTLSASGGTVSASDNYIVPNEGATLASGQTLDLGHVLFALAQNAASTPIQLMFSDYPDTGVNAADGYQYMDVSFAAPDALIIPVGATVVPEPASVVLALQGLFVLRYLSGRSRRMRRRCVQ